MAAELRVYLPPGTGFASMHASIPWRRADARSDLPPRLARACAEVVELMQPARSVFLDRLFLVSSRPESLPTRWPPALENPELDVAAIGRLLVTKCPPPRTLVAIGRSPTSRTPPTVNDWLAAPLDALLAPEQITSFPAPVNSSWSVADLLALAELAAAPPGSALLDERSSEILESAMSHGWGRAPENEVADELVALSVAPAYALRILPGLANYPAELVLEWRDTLNESLDAFRKRIADFAAASQPIESPTEARRQLEIIGAHLDRDFAELQREAQATRLWRATQDQVPTMAGRAATVGVAFGAGFGRPAIGLIALLSASIAQGVTMAFDLAKRRGAMQAHPMHWRYVLGGLGEDDLRSWRRLSSSSHALSRRRALLALFDVPTSCLPKISTAEEDQEKRTKLLTWPTKADWGDVEEAVKGLTADQLEVLALFARLTLASTESDALLEAAVSQPAKEFDEHRDQLEERGMIVALPDPDLPGNVIARLSDRGIGAARLFTARGSPPEYLADHVTRLRTQTRRVISDGPNLSIAEDIDGVCSPSGMA